MKNMIEKIALLIDVKITSRKTEIYRFTTEFAPAKRLTESNYSMSISYRI